MASPKSVNSSNEALIHDLAVRTTIEAGGAFTFVNIPNVEILSASQRDAVFQRAQQMQLANALTARLQSLTPPIDEGKRKANAHVLEAQARKELTDAGCPPCYPPGIDITTRKVSEQFQTIVDYWIASQFGGYLVLCAQRTDYRNFLTHQLKIRHRYGTEWFGTFEDRVRHRRRRHGLGGIVQLLLDPAQQSRLQNWVEFQNYHLLESENLEKERQETLEKLEKARKLASDKDSLSSERAAQSVEAMQIALSRIEYDIKQHKVLLEWIEQQRQLIDQGYATPPQEKGLTPNNGQADTDLRPSARTIRQRDSKASSLTIRGRARVVKPKAKKDTKSSANSSQTMAKASTQELNATPQLATVQEKTTARSTKKNVMPPRAHSPQRLPRASRSTDMGAARTAINERLNQARSTPTKPTRSKRKPAPQRSQPAPSVTKTRSGRISKPPVRWVRA